MSQPPDGPEDEPGEDAEPTGADNPFGIPGGSLGDMNDLGVFLQGLTQMLTGSGSGGSWDAAAQLAGSIASRGAAEPNVDPADRIAVEQLARVAELQIADATGRSGDVPISLVPLNRAQWAKGFLTDEQDLLERIAGSLGQALQAQLGSVDTDDLDPAAAQFGMSPDALIRQVMAMMGPMLLGMMAGSTAGHLAARALSHYELPIPRPVDRPLSMVLSNVDEFADEWSLPSESIRLWVCLSDVAHHQVLTIPHVRDHLTGLLREYSEGFVHDPEVLDERLRALGLDDVLSSGEPDLAAVQQLAGDPDLLLGAMQSAGQREVMSRIQTVVATIEGYVDVILDTVGARLLPDYQQVTEALRRRRVEFGPEARFVERIFGLELSQSTFDRGAAFIEGLVERSGTAVFDVLWSDPTAMPTAAELDAPGLWLARVGVEGVSPDLSDDDLGDIDIPDTLPPEWS
ncbi:MAG: zinc-dependent metalloprotease [Actinomycetota bacterium]